MDSAKIRLSAKEMELVVNADWILTKNGIIEKSRMLLAQLQEEMIAYIKTISPQLTIDAGRVFPKISKGENYNGLPYLILDYPRLFDKQNIFAIRTLFWWGNFFSITLHLGGNYKKQFEKECIQSLPMFMKHDYHFCINTDEWEHHFDTTNYIPVKKINSAEWETLVIEKTFIKVAKKYPLQQWDAVKDKLKDDFILLISLFKSDEL